MHRLVRILSIALITAGLVIAIDVGLTLAWKEPLSTLYGSLQQRQAEEQLSELLDRFPPEDLVREAEAERDTTARARVLADAFADEVQQGEALGRIVIPRIDLDAVFVQGTDTNSLRKGPGHYTITEGPAAAKGGYGSAFPGQGGTVGIAGHRTTYLAPFRHIDQIQPGDEVTLEMPYGRFTYEVQGHEIVDPGANEIVKNMGYERLVLTACHPLYSAAQRYAQFAKLTDVSLTAPGAGTSTGR